MKFDVGDKVRINELVYFSGRRTDYIIESVTWPDVGSFKRHIKLKNLPGHQFKPEWLTLVEKVKINKDYISRILLAGGEL